MKQSGNKNICNTGLFRFDGFVMMNERLILAVITIRLFSANCSIIVSYQQRQNKHL